MSDPISRIQTLIRTEMAVAQLQANRAASKTGLMLVALVFGLIGLGMFNVAGFYALMQHFGPAISAMLMGLLNISLVTALIFMAKKSGPSENEEKLAKELREMAYIELNNDLEPIKEDINKLLEDINTIRSGFNAFSGGVTNITPVLNVLLSALKR